MATKTVINISPKVLTGGLCGLGVAVVEAVAAAVTPHTLDFLGAWEPLALAAVPPLLGQIAAWFKKEQDAEAAQVQNAHVLPVLTGDAVAAAQVAPLVPATFDQLLTPTNDAAAHAAATSPAV